MTFVPTRGRLLRLTLHIYRMRDTVLLIQNIVQIHLGTGAVTGKLHMAHLYPTAERARGADCMNGIAYNATDDTYLLTGKLWPKVGEASRQTGRCSCPRCCCSAILVVVLLLQYFKVKIGAAANATRGAVKRLTRRGGGAGMRGRSGGVGSHSGGRRRRRY